jgi:AraC-like DNA-binding protein
MNEAAGAVRHWRASARTSCCRSSFAEVLAATLRECEAHVPVKLQIEDLEPTDRLDVLRGRMSAAPVPLELRPLEPLDVRATTRVADFGRVHLLSTEATGAWVCRTARLARDATEPQILISVLERGATSVASHQGTVAVQPGEVVVNSTLVPYAVAFTGTVRHTFSVSYADLGLPRAVLHAALGRPLGHAHPLAPGIGTFLTHLARTPQLPTQYGHALQDPVVSLFRALLATSAGDEFRARGPLAETLGHRAEQYIRTHYTDPALTPQRVAEVHGISVRYLYRVLSDLGFSPAGLIRDLRLDACARALASPGSTRISAIAHNHGFVDQAHFTRAFKQRFGCTPTQWRHDGQGPAAGPPSAGG